MNATHTASPPSVGLMPVERLLSLKDVMAITSFSKQTIYRHMTEGLFPRPLRISKMRVAWRMSAIARWQSSLATDTPRVEAA